MPTFTTLDTMGIAGGGTLSACCTAYGVKFDGRAHAALHDARATAWLSLKDALALVDIKVLDHIIVAGATGLSFAEKGLL